MNKEIWCFFRNFKKPENKKVGVRDFGYENEALKNVHKL